MNTEALSYNTGRNRLVIQEYGRNIQNMIEHLLSIEDKTNRSQAAHFVVSVMAQMNPQVKETEDYMHKLWDHMHIIAGYELDIDGPYEMPSKAIQDKKPEHPGYGQKKPKYGHYGHYIIEMIELAKKVEDEEEKKAMSLAIANQLKKDYLNWNKESVNDNIILAELERVSNGELVLPDDTRLIAQSEVVGRNPAAQSAAKKKKPNKKKEFAYKRNNNRQQR
jgi:hypothetical protein